MRKHPWWTFGGNDTWITTTHKRSNGKRSIFLAVSLANQSDWIYTKQIRIHQCCLHELWMKGERHIHPLCLWKDKLMDHSLICKLGGYTSMRQNSVRDSLWDTDNERGLWICSDQTHTSTIQWEWLWKKSQHCRQCKVGYLCERIVE